MWSEKAASAEARVGRYWDDLVSGAQATTEIEPTLKQTIAWLERVDDAQPASAEFSRRFETDFLHAIGSAPAVAADSVGAAAMHRPLPSAIAATPSSRAIHLPTQRSRLLGAIAAGLLLFLALGIALYARERFGDSQNSNVVLAPLSPIEVPMDRGDAARSGVMPGPSIPNGLESTWQFEAGWNGVSAPAVAGNTVFLTSGSEIGSGSANQGAVVAVDALTGSERWRFPIEQPASSTPAVAAGIVYAGDRNGTVYALDAETGRELWRQTLEGAWTSAPVIVDDTVYIAVAPYRASLYVAVQDGVAVVGSGLSGQPGEGIELYALDRTSGAVRWQSGGELFRQPGLFAFDTDSGTLLWQFDMPSLESGPAISSGLVYAGSTLDGNVYALELSTGTTAWVAPVGEDLPLDSSPVISNGSVFLTTAFGSVIALDATSGVERWRASAEHLSLNSSAVVVGSVVYVVDTNWGLSAFATEDGAVLWRQQLALSGQVAVSPVIANGTLFIGTSLDADDAYVATLWAFTGS